MRLAENDPGGTLTNRPLDSLRRIFLAWMPNTHAPLNERLAVCRAVCTASPAKGLALAMSLLPTPYDHSHATAKPRLRSFGDSETRAVTDGEVNTAYRYFGELAVELAGRNARALSSLVDALPLLEKETRAQALEAMRLSAAGAEPQEAFELWEQLRGLAQKHRGFQEAGWALPPGDLEPIEEAVKQLEPRDPVKQVVWLFNDYSPKGGMPKGQDYMEEANRDRADAVRKLRLEHGVPALLELARGAKLPHFVGIAIGEASDAIEDAQEAFAASLKADAQVPLDSSIALSAVAHYKFTGAWDDWFVKFAASMETATVASLFLRWPDNRDTWNVVSQVSPEVDAEYWRRKWAFRQSAQDGFKFAFTKYMSIGRFSAILDMIAYDESLLSTAECVQVLQGLLAEINSDPSKLQHAHHAVLEMIKELERRQDANIEDVAALEYQYFPVLEHQAEPVALNRVLGMSPVMFMRLICDAFAPASGLAEEVTDERKARAGLAYRLLRAMTYVPGFSAERADLDHLRWWISEVRRLADEADRAVITDQQIGQILAFAPGDSEDDAWPSRNIRNLIEELANEEIERGISISRFNQRGATIRGLYDGGAQERGLANTYKTWAGATRTWPRTSALLTQIAESWERHAEYQDTEAKLNQLID